MIHTISELLKEVSEFKSEFFDEQIYYRGQKNGTKAGWMLLPTFYREKKQYTIVPFYSDKKEELNTIYKFVIKEIPISPDSIEDLKRELRLIGISKSTIYPALTEETKY